MTRKFTKMTVVLAVLALCCFMFAGMAAAAGQFSFTTESNPIDGSATNYVKANHTYNYDINVTGINAPVEQFTDNEPPVSPPDGEQGHKLVLTFPEGFCSNSNFDGSKSVSAYLTIGGEEYGPIQVMPEIANDVSEGCESDCSVSDQVYFTIERQLLPDTLKNPAYVTAVRIAGFEVVTPLEPGQYQVCVTHNQASCGIDACASLTVVKTVGSISIEGYTEQCLYAGGQITVYGTMLDTCEQPWTDTTWPIIVELKKKTTDVECGKDCITYDDVLIANEEMFSKNCFGADTFVEQKEESSKVVLAQVVHVMINEKGQFSANLKLPTWLEKANNEEWVVTARTIEVRDEKAAYDNPIEWKFGDQPDSKVPAESIEDLDNEPNHVKRGTYAIQLPQGPYTTKAHAWLKANDYVIDEIQPGNPYAIVQKDLGPQIDLAERVEVKINLVDKFGNPTKNAIACGEPLPPLKVELRAVDCNDPTKIAGKFYDIDGNEIVYALIEYDSNTDAPDYVTVYFEATKVGKVTLQESVLFGPADAHQSITGQCCLEVNEDGGCLKVTYLVTGDACTPGGPSLTGTPQQVELPKAGWPVKISLIYPEQATIRVELLEKVGEDFKVLPSTPKKQGDSYATWSLNAKTYGIDANGDLVDGLMQYLTYNADGDKASMDTFNHNTGVPYSQQKSDFFVYFKNVFATGANGQLCIPKDFWVKIVDVDNNIHQYVQVGSFMSATDMVRVLEPDTWQILSTPKALAGDGDMSTLLPVTNKVPPYSEILTYKDNAWQQVTTEKLEPLYAYLLNMRQNDCDPGQCDDPLDCGGTKDIYAKYVFARAVDPYYAMPAERLLSKGANLIAPAFNEEEVNPLAWLGNELITLGDVELENDLGCFKDLGCFLYEGECGTCSGCPDCTPTLGNCLNSPICPALLFQANSMASMTGSFCDGCTMIMNYGGDSAEDCRNSKGNLGYFNTVTLGSSNVQSWLQDPMYYAYNGDGYLVYLTASNTMRGSAQLDLVKVTDNELYPE